VRLPCCRPGCLRRRDDSQRDRCMADATGIYYAQNPVGGQAPSPVALAGRADRRGRLSPHRILRRSPRGFPSPTLRFIDDRGLVESSPRCRTATILRVASANGRRAGAFRRGCAARRARVVREFAPPATGRDRLLSSAPSTAAAGSSALASAAASGRPAAAAASDRAYGASSTTAHRSTRCACRPIASARARRGGCATR